MFGSQNKNQAEKQLLLRLIFLFRPWVARCTT